MPFHTVKHYQALEKKKFVLIKHLSVLTTCCCALLVACHPHTISVARHKRFVEATCCHGQDVVQDVALILTAVPTPTTWYGTTSRGLVPMWRGGNAPSTPSAAPPKSAMEPTHHIFHGHTMNERPNWPKEKKNGRLLRIQYSPLFFTSTTAEEKFIWALAARSADPGGERHAGAGEENVPLPLFKTRQEKEAYLCTATSARFVSSQFR